MQGQSCNCQEHYPTCGTQAGPKAENLPLLEAERPAAGGSVDGLHLLIWLSEGKPTENSPATTADNPVFEGRAPETGFDRHCVAGAAVRSVVPARAMEC
jgi:hypothetical protein